jgi:hypothetical protein
MKMHLKDRMLQQELKRKGLERSKLFTWEKTSMEYLALHNDLRLFK